jgi:UDPglucose 6-dehydrogenase
MKLTVVGSGYVGLVTGVCFAEVGHDVVCVDTDTSKVAMLRDNIPPIYEPGLDELLKRNAAHGRLHFTTALVEGLKDSVAVFIAVGTPEGEDGSSDLRYVKAVASEIGRLVSEDLLVVVKSTVPVGTCDMVEATIQSELAKRQFSGGTRRPVIRVASNPEFLKEGTAIDDFMKPDRIVTGVTDTESAAIFQEMYAPFIQDDPARLLVTQRRSSEMTKYGANAMLATRISFMNELSRLCELVGANIDDVRRGIGADPRIGKKFLYAGPGYGGSCFPKDVEALLSTARQNDCELTVLKAVSHTNKLQKMHVARKIHSYFNGDCKGRKIAVWGLAFKPGTDDVREAPALTILSALVNWGATVVAHDPVAQKTFERAWSQAGMPSTAIAYVDDSYDALKGADALVLLTEWPEYKRPSWEKARELLKAPVVFDLRNQYSFQTLSGQGFHYECVGRPDSRSAKRSDAPIGGGCR